MVEFLTAALILGFAAVFAVPWLSSLLGGFVPANYKSYLPSATMPGFTIAAAVNALVFGIVLAAVLALLYKIGLRAHTKGIEV